MNIIKVFNVNLVIKQILYILFLHFATACMLKSNLNIEKNQEPIQFDTSEFYFYNELNSDKKTQLGETLKLNFGLDKINLNLSDKVTEIESVNLFSDSICSQKITDGVLSNKQVQFSFDKILTVGKHEFFVKIKQKSVNENCLIKPITVEIKTNLNGVVSLMSVTPLGRDKTGNQARIAVLEQSLESSEYIDVFSEENCTGSIIMKMDHTSKKNGYYEKITPSLSIGTYKYSVRGSDDFGNVGNCINSNFTHSVEAFDPIASIVNDSEGLIFYLTESGKLLIFGETSINTQLTSINQKRIKKLYANRGAIFVIYLDETVGFYFDSERYQYNDPEIGIPFNASDFNSNDPVNSVLTGPYGVFLVQTVSGKIIAWGNYDYGGDISSVSSELNGANKVIKLYLSETGGAAIRQNGSVVTWGMSAIQDSVIQNKVNGQVPVEKIFYGSDVFIAIRQDGQMVIWGYGSPIDTSPVNSELANSIKITNAVFAVANGGSAGVLREDGSVVIWGEFDGDQNTYPDSIVYSTADVNKKATSLVANEYSYAAILADGSVLVWGDPTNGADISGVASSLNGNIKVSKILGLKSSFVALRENGSIITWGDGEFSTSEVENLVDGSVKVVSMWTEGSYFFLTRENNSTVILGYNTYSLFSDQFRQALISNETKKQVVYSNGQFSILKSNGRVITDGWINVANHGVDLSGVLNANKAVDILSNNDVNYTNNIDTFSILNLDGTINTLGSFGYGGNTNSIFNQLNPSNIKNSKVYPNRSGYVALRENGSIFIFGSNLASSIKNQIHSQLDGTTKVVNIYESSYAFAALKENGSVTTWGSAMFGGDSSSVSSEINGSVKVTKVFTNTNAMAALRENGSVITWGNTNYGGNSSSVANQLNGSVKVIDIVSTNQGFTALNENGALVNWGYQFSGNAFSNISSQVNGTIKVVKIISNELAYAALRENGSVVVWGDPNSGGSLGTKASLLNGTVKVVKLYSSPRAFAAIREDGSVVAWGASTVGGDTTVVDSALNGSVDVVEIFGMGWLGFSALRSDGSLVYWGNYTNGSNAINNLNPFQLSANEKVVKVVYNLAITESGAVKHLLLGADFGNASSGLNGVIKVVKVVPYANSFLALREDGSIIFWKKDNSNSPNGKLQLAMPISDN